MGEAGLLVSSLYDRVQISTRRSVVSAWPVSSNAITTTAAPYRRIDRACPRNCSSPSFKLIELTMPLPWMHFRPASMTDHFELSIMIGTREMFGSEAIRLRNRVIAASESSMLSSMFTSIICAPFSTCCRATASASSYWSFLISLAKRGEPVTLVRSPTLTKLDSGRTVNASMPLSRNHGSGLAKRLGSQSATALAISRICPGVVPQQPPTMFSQPLAAQSCNCGANDSGVSGKPVGSSGSGMPAFGCALTLTGAMRESSPMCDRISCGPSAQLIPTLTRSMLDTEFQ
ncbi:MAG: hypothetical protein CM1200mP34_1560 [Verrucomicrobiales bacterium]|nr:MAG: hypothetical protein CM1200mP34_1560 [Verrucomicrobiales bacterium]